MPVSLLRWNSYTSSVLMISLGIYFGGCRPAPIKVGACRALAQLFEQVDVPSLRPHLGSVFAALAKLLQEVSLTFQAIRSAGYSYFAVAACREASTVYNMKLHTSLWN